MPEVQEVQEADFADSDDVQDEEDRKSLFNSVLSRSMNGDDMNEKGMETGEETIDADELPTQGADRKDFLWTSHPASLYLWYMLLQAGLFQSAKTEFPTGYLIEGEEIASLSSIESNKTRGNTARVAAGNEFLKTAFGDMQTSLDNNLKHNAQREKQEDITVQVAELQRKQTLLQDVIKSEKEAIGKLEQMQLEYSVKIVSASNQEKAAINKVLGTVQERITTQTLNVKARET